MGRRERVGQQAAQGSLRTRIMNSCYNQLQESFFSKTSTFIFDTLRTVDSDDLSSYFTTLVSSDLKR